MKCSYGRFDYCLHVLFGLLCHVLEACEKILGKIVQGRNFMDNLTMNTLTVQEGP